MAALEGRHGARKELSGPGLELQDFGRGDLVQGSAQSGSFGPQEEELLPETLGFLAIVVILLGGVSSVSGLVGEKSGIAGLEGQQVGEGRQTLKRES